MKRRRAPACQTSELFTMSFEQQDHQNHAHYTKLRQNSDVCTQAPCGLCGKNFWHILGSIVTWDAITVPSSLSDRLLLRMPQGCCPRPPNHNVCAGSNTHLRCLERRFSRYSADLSADVTWKLRLRFSANERAVSSSKRNKHLPCRKISGKSNCRFSRH